MGQRDITMQIVVDWSHPSDVLGIHVLIKIRSLMRVVNGYQVDLPTYTTLQVLIIKGDLSTYHTNNLKRFKAYEERSTKVTLLSISQF